MNGLPPGPRLTPAAPFPADCDALYEPIELLGQGGFGAVYRAVHRALKRPAAVKLLLDEVLDDPEQVRRFTEEGRITAAVRHPAVVRVLDAGAATGVPWIAYELIAGESLRDRLAAGPLSVRAAVDVAAQVCDALAAAHAAGVVHRDIKPENVIVDDQGRCTVMDFGIASWARRHGVKTATGMILGTPAYLSPEQISGEPASPASDLYAVGILLHELVTGVPPYGDAPPMLVLERHLKSAIPVPSRQHPGIPAALDALVASALAKKPEQRPRSAAALAASLRGIPGDASPPPAEVSAPSRSSDVTARAVRVRAPEAPASSAPPLRRVGIAVGALAGLAILGRILLFPVSRPPVPVVLDRPPPTASASTASSASSGPATAVAFRPAFTCRAGRDVNVEALIVRRMNQLLAEDAALTELHDRISAIAPKTWSASAARPLQAMVDHLDEFVKELIAEEVQGPIWLEGPFEIAWRLKNQLRRDESALAESGRATIQRLKDGGVSQLGADPFSRAYARVIAALPPDSEDEPGAHQLVLDALARCPADWQGSLSGHWCKVLSIEGTLRAMWRRSIIDMPLRGSPPADAMMARLLGEAIAFARATPADFLAEMETREHFEDVMSNTCALIRTALGRLGHMSHEMLTEMRRAVDELEKKMNAAAALHRKASIYPGPLKEIEEIRKKLKARVAAASKPR